MRRFLLLILLLAGCGDKHHGTAPCFTRVLRHGVIVYEPCPTPTPTPSPTPKPHCGDHR